MDKNNVQNENLFNSYVMYELVYEERCKKLKKNLDFPKQWYRNTNYQEKIEILKEAITNEKSILETELFKKFINKE